MHRSHFGGCGLVESPARRLPEFFTLDWSFRYWQPGQHRVYTHLPRVRMARPIQGIADSLGREAIEVMIEF